tara:strand:- start:131 stop:394 length:264 start_codon:yes stop_codon:yes gene_type:complete
MKKFTSIIVLITISISLSITSPVHAQDGSDSEKRLRKGTCWLDGSETCRKKKSGENCENTKRCSLKAYLEATAKIVALIAAVDALDD